LYAGQGWRRGSRRLPQESACSGSEQRSLEREIEKSHCGGYEAAACEGEMRCIRATRHTITHLMSRAGTRIPIASSWGGGEGTLVGTVDACAVQVLRHIPRSGARHDGTRWTRLAAAKGWLEGGVAISPWSLSEFIAAVSWLPCMLNYACQAAREIGIISLKP
jgi:hypothetical protein